MRIFDGDLFFRAAEREININRSLTDGGEEKGEISEWKCFGPYKQAPENTEGGDRSRWLGLLLSLSRLSFLSLFLSLSSPSLIFFLLLIVSRTQLSNRECRRDVNACKILSLPFERRAADSPSSFSLFARSVWIIRINLTLTTRVSWERCILGIIISRWKFVPFMQIYARAWIFIFFAIAERDNFSWLKYYFNIQQGFPTFYSSENAWSLKSMHLTFVNIITRYKNIII